MLLILRDREDILSQYHTHESHQVISKEYAFSQDLDTPQQTKHQPLTQDRNPREYTDTHTDNRLSLP
jgi:hypothetical protein